jgi:hypothetical protein
MILLDENGALGFMTRAIGGVSAYGGDALKRQTKAKGKSTTSMFELYIH